MLYGEEARPEEEEAAARWDALNAAAICTLQHHVTRELFGAITRTPADTARELMRRL